MKKISIILNCNGIGDILSSIPTIKYLYNVYNYKIPVFTSKPFLLKNYPYIDVYPISDVNQYSDIYNIISTFQVGLYVHTRNDIRQLHSNSIGVELLPNEMNIEFYPDKYIKIDNLPKNYIVLHPSKNWPSRTWHPFRWQKLAILLNNLNIPIVIIGKDSSELGTYNTQKPIFNIKIKNGLDLSNKIDIHQTWHILNMSKIVVTMDSGILHLAGTTNSHIIQLGSSINPKFRAPYRYGHQNYKYSYLLGSCNKYCASNSKYSFKLFNNHNTLPPVPFCLDNMDTIGKNCNINMNIYKCHPDTNIVFNEIKRILNI